MEKKKPQRCREQGRAVGVVKWHQDVTRGRSFHQSAAGRIFFALALLLRRRILPRQLLWKVAWLPFSFRSVHKHSHTLTRKRAYFTNAPFCSWASVNSSNYRAAAPLDVKEKGERRRRRQRKSNGTPRTLALARCSEKEASLGIWHRSEPEVGQGGCGLWGKACPNPAHWRCWDEKETNEKTP